MDYRLYNEVEDVVSSGIYITGATRSGTTMMGQLISSLEDVEYAEEPPMVRLLLPLIHEMPKDIFKFLFEGYVFEEHMMYTLPGRKINLNQFDQSSIYNSKSSSEINKRLEKSYRRIEIFPKALTCTPAIKVPETAQDLKKLFSYYPKMKVIIMLRHPESVIASILERQWFTNDALYGSHGRWHFLNEKKSQNGNTPIWLKENEVENFYAMSELERCIMYYKREYSNILDLGEDLFKKNEKIIIDYNKFVSNPKVIFEKIVKLFGLKKGDITDTLLNNIKEPIKNRKLTWENTDNHIKTELFDIYNKLLKFSI